MGMLSGARVPLAAMDKSRSNSRKGSRKGSNLVTDIAFSSWCGVCPGTMCGLGWRGPLTRQGGSPAAPHSGLPAAAGGEGVHFVSRPGPGSLARGTHVRQLHLPPDNARHRDHHERGYDDDRADEDHGRLPPVTLGYLGRRRRLIPVSALSLHSQLETSNGFLEIVAILQGGELECPDQPRPVAAVHRPRPGRAAPRLAAGPGSTERGAYGIVNGLTEPATWRSRKTAALPDPGAPPAARTRQPGTLPSAASWPCSRAPARDCS